MDKKKFIKVNKDMFEDLTIEVDVPKFKCACGEIVLDTPLNRRQSEIYESNHTK